MSPSEIHVPAADGVAEAYFVTPAGPGPYPAVLMFMDAFGLRPRLMEMARRIAARGYAVLVPNLFYRDASGPLVTPEELTDGAKRGAAFGRLMPMIRALTPERITADATAYLDFLAGQEKVADGPAGLVGYCMGGRNALIVTAALPDRIAALGSFHAGGVVTDAPDSPHTGVAAITAEVYFAHADDDGSMRPEQIKTLEAAFDAAGVTYTSELYEGAPHGFTMSDTSMHHEEGERRHWEALFALLGRTLPVR
ncbi:carboxymethylenebutenolidase [Actinoplanes campanulatus]|uniref:Carboxymethylenebutenolidase n=1 Tax=Actinoplanes campanulatus TaxID=113559 RepID=A0A7W5FH68_9ACTN|nr:dienelactone hydrolase family protein [Actinoplanes campanulatus]MBB3098289.1 carboxymethylenebutenolidase [Actinoplanes campanulatus]GGN34547.1 hydrolase [Actinoplanes campanulatus]GID38753.1 hydrolase [Actinoplanes campanulatus]